MSQFEPLPRAVVGPSCPARAPPWGRRRAVPLARTRRVGSARTARWRWPASTSVSTGPSKARYGARAFRRAVPTRRRRRAATWRQTEVAPRRRRRPGRQAKGRSRGAPHAPRLRLALVAVAARLVEGDDDEQRDAVEARGERLQPPELVIDGAHGRRRGFFARRARSPRRWRFRPASPAGHARARPTRTSATYATI